MESRTVDVWEQTTKNPPKEYEEYFVKEKEFLKENLSESSVALDIGCGTGRTIKELAPFIKRFVGIDNDRTAIESSERNLKNIDNVEVFFEDAESMNFKDQTFNIIFIGLTFCNFAESKENILSEIRRILKDDGYLIFSVFNEDSLGVRKKTYKEYKGGYTVLDEEKGKVRFDADGGISEQFSREEIIDILHKAKFKIIEIKKDSLSYLIKARKSNY